MKLNLLMHGTDVRAGYRNIDGFPDLPDNQAYSEEKEKGDVLDLDWAVDDESCDEIVAISVLNTCFLGQIQEVMRNWSKKLKPGGKLVLGSSDLKEICKGVHLDAMPFETSIQLLYGQQNVGIWDLYKNSLTPEVMRGLLEQNGFTITKQRHNHLNIIVEGTKGYVQNNV